MSGPVRHTVPHPATLPTKELETTCGVGGTQHTILSTDCCQGHLALVGFNCEGRLFLAFLPSLAGSNQHLHLPAGA